ncbi:MAG: hypothetical protein UV38_C0002G0161 [candidate division TM6 bacterium GW2011_GWE2_42_60]|nr:MAG: hypothetical protein UV38_C0002G0161 [candidate division TM6 bacterium GW2011_GWE2_42_60]HBY06082.1 hypothetical protein [Candidatus Dependentiae bacterium]
MNIKHILLACYFIALGVGISYGVFAALKTPLTALFAVNAGPLPNENTAKIICPLLCQSRGGTWTQQWKAGASGKAGFCFCLKNAGKPFILTQQTLPQGLIQK